MVDYKQQQKETSRLDARIAILEHSIILKDQEIENLKVDVEKYKGKAKSSQSRIAELERLPYQSPAELVVENQRLSARTKSLMDENMDCRAANTKLLKENAGRDTKLTVAQACVDAGVKTLDDFERKNDELSEQNLTLTSELSTLQVQAFQNACNKADVEKAEADRRHALDLQTRAEETVTIQQKLVSEYERRLGQQEEDLEERVGRLRESEDQLTQQMGVLQETLRLKRLPPSVAERAGQDTV
jgi:chromosome segregation ATPase